LKEGFFGASAGAAVGASALGAQPTLKAASAARQSGRNLRDMRVMISPG
jgi:hypothetical protein